MGTGRVEAFSDGVIAVIVTIMVLEFKPPEHPDLAGLLALKLPFLDYILSFLVIAIFWVNHRTMLGIVKDVNARVLWTNNNVLFWMSLIPFATAYMGQTSAAPLAVSVYAAVLALTSGAFALLRFAVAAQHRTDSKLRHHHKRLHFKDFTALLLYCATIPLAFVSVRLSFFIFILIPALYFLPERIVEL